MLVDTAFDEALGAFPVAGTPAAARMVAALARQETSGDLHLWVKGLFPLIEAGDLDAFVTFTRAEGSAWWPSAHEPESGLLASVDPDGRRETTKTFRDRAPLEQVYDGPSAAAAGQAAFRANARAAAEAGAVLLAPDHTWIEDGVVVEAGATVEPNAYLGGSTHIASGVHIGSGSHIRDARIAAGTRIKPYSVIEQAVVGPSAQIGPFAHLRPGTEIGEAVRVGNFVETKNAKLGKGAKASHLTYLGDAVVGEGANVGAGTITCNYDGFGKHLTEIGAGVFVGSNSQLVAPVRLGDGAYVAAGSTVTSDVEADALVIARSRQVVKEGLAPTIRARARALKESQPDP